MPRSKIVAYVLFCDDVRQELGDKKTFVGVYGPKLFVPTIPTLIPKFHVVTTLICYYNELPKRLCVSLKYRDSLIGKTELDENDLKEWYEVADALKSEISEFPADDPPKMRMTVEVYISPFVIQEEGRLSAFVETDAGSVRTGSIEIVKDENAESSSALPIHEKLEQIK